MKAKKLIIAFVAILALMIAMPMETTATPPPWAPAHGYRAKTRHIYFPQQNFYYDLHRGVYLYMTGQNWVTSVAIPTVYRNINLRVVPQIEMSIHTDYPYKYNHKHRAKYWNSKTQKEYYKRMEKNRKAYQKEMKKAQKDYYKRSKKATKKYYKNNGKKKRYR